MTHANHASTPGATYDRTALEVAQAVHRTERPETTILFGSRAKDTQDETESDIDILLAVSTECPDDREWLQAQDRAQQTADVLYGRKVPVQLEYITMQELEEQAQYTDTSAGAALVHGVFAGGDPDQFKHIYDRDDPPPPKYLFENYKLNTKLSLQAMHAMLTVHHKRSHPAGSKNQIIRVLESMANSTRANPEDLYGIIRSQAAESMSRAVIAAHWATGKPPGNRDTLAGKYAKLATVLPGTDFKTQLPMDLYEDAKSIPAMAQEAFVNAAESDISKLRDYGKEIRRRTAAGARKASRNAQAPENKRTAGTDH